MALLDLQLKFKSANVRQKLRASPFLECFKQSFGVSNLLFDVGDSWL